MTNTPEFNILAAMVFNERLAQTDLVTRTNFDAKLKEISDRVADKTKHCLLKLN